MMTKLIAAVEQLVNDEYARASKDHGDRFHSLHEAFGVLMEEFEETRDELETVSRFLNGFWKEVKRDSCDIVFLNEAKKAQSILLVRLSKLRRWRIRHGKG